MLCAILLLFGCGADETSLSIQQEQEPNYFPDGIGSRWVYWNTAGTQWTREITGSIDIDGKPYRVLTDTPPIPNAKADPDFLTWTYHRTTPNQVLCAIGEKIDRYVQAELPKAVQDEFAGLELNVTTAPLAASELILLQLPLAPNLQWDAFRIKIAGNIRLQNLALLQVPFEMEIHVKAEVTDKIRLQTSAGDFEASYRITYQTEIAYTVFSATETTQQRKQIWFVPHVGIVKTETDQDVMELIGYTLASTPEN